MKIKFAVIGGSGLYDMKGTTVVEEREIPTPFGLPSDLISILDIQGIKAAFLSRHGKGHRLLPGEVPSLANIWALKSLGVQQILSVSAVGSLVAEYKPGDFVVCDQSIDRTRNRPVSYFGEGVVGHVNFSNPFCSAMSKEIIDIIRQHSHSCHETGTLVCMEGPQFSTRSESTLHKNWKAHIIGMTTMPEAKLAREAEICYALIAMVTDYDCWKQEEESVTVEMVLKVMKDNVASIRTIVPDIIKKLNGRIECPCQHAAKDAIMTDYSLIPYNTRRKLALFYEKYWR